MTRRLPSVPALIAILGILGLACGGKDPAPAATPGGSQAAPAAPASDPPPPDAAPAGPEVEFAGWEGWTKINEERFESGGHNKAFVDVYVEAAHVDIYRSTAEAPVGMRVVKAQYQETDDTEPAMLTVMAKRDPGYDSERGDWYYGVFAPDGTSVKQQGKLASCSGCHTSAAGSDYLFRQ